MKKILLLLLTSSLFSGVFDGLENPNGKPFLLSISTNLLERATMENFNNHDSDYTVYQILGRDVTDAEVNTFHIFWSMPISNYATLSGYILNEERNQEDSNLTSTINQFAITFHLPLYKLWE